MLSEWSDASYGAAVPVFDLSGNRLGGTQTLGQFYASYFTLQWGDAWAIGGIGFLLGYAVLLGPILTSLAMTRCRWVLRVE